MKRKDFLKACLALSVVPFLPKFKKGNKEKKWEFPMSDWGATRCPKCREMSFFVCRCRDGEKNVGVDFNCINCGYYEYHERQNFHYFLELKRENWSFKENGYAYIKGRVVTYKDIK